MPISRSAALSLLFVCHCGLGSRGSAKGVLNPVRRAVDSSRCCEVEKVGRCNVSARFNVPLRDKTINERITCGLGVRSHLIARDSTNASNENGLRGPRHNVPVYLMQATFTNVPCVSDDCQGCSKLELHGGGRQGKGDTRCVCRTALVTIGFLKYGDRPYHGAGAWASWCG